MANESVRFFYLLKNYIVMVLLFADLILNAFIDHIGILGCSLLPPSFFGVPIPLIFKRLPFNHSKITTARIADHVESNVLSFAIIGLQIVLRIVMLFILILLMWDTFVFKQGLLGVLCRQFKGNEQACGVRRLEQACGVRRLAVELMWGELSFFEEPFHFMFVPLCCCRFCLLDAGVFICSPISFVLMLVLRAMKLSATASKTLLLDQWSTPSYQALYFLHNISNVLSLFLRR